MAQRVAGELYESITGQLFELGRQLRQPNGYPFNPHRLKLHLQAAVEGRFASGDVFSIKLGGPETTDEVVQSLKERDGFNFVNDLITQTNFPLIPREAEDIEIEIIDPKRPFSEAEGLEFLKAAGLERPTCEHALRFAEQRGTATTSEKKPFVIFLHEAWLDPRDHRRVLYLDRYSASRRLSLIYPDGRFNDDCVLAGVRPRKSKIPTREVQPSVA